MHGPRLRVIRAMRALHALVLGGLALIVLAIQALSSRPGTDVALARRLLLLHGHAGTPKIVTRNEIEGLEVVTASGRHQFWLEPPCDESLPCLMGLWLLCWEEAPRDARAD